MTPVSLQVIAPTLLFLVFLLLSRKKKKVSGISHVYFGLSLLWTLGLVAFIASDYFTGNGIDEATLFHLRYGVGGAGFSEYTNIITGCIVILLFFTWLSCKLIYSSTKEESPFTFPLLSLFLLCSFIFNPGFIDIYKAFNIKHESSVDSDFEQYHANSNIIHSSEIKKNIVYIYAESLEANYFDESLFPDLTPNINALKTKSTSYTHIKQVHKTGWTIAGLTASQCGIPLITPSHGNSMSGLPQFLSGANCLGDILKNQGYRLSFFGGAKLKFAGKGKFLNSHGFDNSRGYKEHKIKYPDKKFASSWGLYDDKLLDITFEEYEKLSAIDEPFGLFTLTLDTHHPKGHVSSGCGEVKYQDGSNPILNAVKCSDILLSKFINKVLASPAAKNTIVVLASDHLAMRNTATHLLKQKPRNNLFLVFDPSSLEQKIVETEGSTLDIASTLLSYLGYKGRVGIGYDLRGDNKDIAKTTHGKLGIWEPDFLKFWQFPSITRYTVVDSVNHIIKIDDKPIKIPTMIEVKPNLETTVRFEFNRSAEHKSFKDHIGELKESSRYIWIDRCSKIKAVGISQAKDQYCLKAGKDQATGKTIALKPYEKLPIRKLRELMGMQ